MRCWASLKEISRQNKLPSGCGIVVDSYTGRSCRKAKEKRLRIHQQLINRAHDWAIERRICIELYSRLDTVRQSIQVPAKVQRVEQSCTRKLLFRSGRDQQRRPASASDTMMPRGCGMLHTVLRFLLLCSRSRIFLLLVG